MLGSDKDLYTLTFFQILFTFCIKYLSDLEELSLRFFLRQESHHSMYVLIIQMWKHNMRLNAIVKRKVGKTEPFFAVLGTPSLHFFS